MRKTNNLSNFIYNCINLDILDEFRDIPIYFLKARKCSLPFRDGTSGY